MTLDLRQIKDTSSHFWTFAFMKTVLYTSLQFYTLTRAGVRNKAKYRWNGGTDKIAFSDPRQLNFLSRKNNFTWHMRRSIRLSLKLFFSSEFESILEAMHLYSSLHSLFCIVTLYILYKNTPVKYFPWNRNIKFQKYSFLAIFCQTAYQWHLIVVDILERSFSFATL